MESLRELVERGRHELAAHRLVLGVMKEYVRERQPVVESSDPVSSSPVEAHDAMGPKERDAVG
jgi:hypothetical protein